MNLPNPQRLLKTNNPAEHPHPTLCNEDPLNGTAIVDHNLFGSAGKDRLIGQADHDLLYAGSGNETLHGGTGGDFLNRNDDRSILHGGTGGDFLNRGTDTEQLLDGEESDLAVYANAAASIYMNLATGFVTGTDGVDRLLTMEDVSGR